MGCEKLKSIDLSNFSNIEIINPFFLNGCESLRQIDLTSFKKVVKIEHDCKLIKQYNKYYLLVPVKINKKNNKQSNQIISLDAGNRTFLTGYSPNGHTLEINRNKKLLIKYFERLDLLRSLRTKKKIRKTKL